MSTNSLQTPIRLARIAVATVVLALALGHSPRADARRHVPTSKPRAVPAFDEGRYAAFSATSSVFLAMTAMGERVTKASPRTLAFYTQDVVEHCRTHNIDPVFFTAILWVEAKFQSNLKSPAGACGLAQVMPSRRHPCDRLMNPSYGIGVGVKALSNWIRVAGKDALCHYNGGNLCTAYSRIYERKVWAVYEQMRRHISSKRAAVDET